MKILHLISQIPDATGSGIYLQEVLRLSERKGFHNILLAGVPEVSDYLNHLALQPHCYHPVYFDKDIPFPVVGMSDVMPYPSSRFCDLTLPQLEHYLTEFEKTLDEAIVRHRPDLIHSHHLWLLTALAKQKYPDIPMIASCHGSDLRQFHNCQHLRDMVLPGCRMVDTICALSEIQKLEIEQLYQIDGKRIQVVGTGYNDRRFYRPSQNSRRNAHVEILFAGKLSRSKGLPWLLQALHRLPNHSGFTFHLVGEGHGPEKNEIIELSEKLGNRIQLHGKLDQDQLATLMRKADLFVLPSFFEGLPLVLLEALACGCRIITTALPGINELFDNIESNRIHLIPLPNMIAIDVPHPADEEQFICDLSAALLRQISALKADETYSETSSEKIQELLKRYTWEGLFEKLQGLYQNLLK